ncbi:hypothetical protein GYMLUDRAFT_42852 [Collybiopsis luxurians FD-317 M1]|uniref:Unplaced genomic scaffold GYMLUscaffold_22, whole genome shotgun sequence n=1 Tax=Collybiopsis luxurians FD-317 M1 TaxID=944289 RepID=A0A0D0CRG5_9AGAR|nr:hypothetical protein GYMLUDRAFT_42852 [Collybiopsis luxurians FD-317 M1]
MAFPVPTHLPRRAAPQDVTSKILSTMDEATNKSLTASLANSWLEELDTTIQSTKEQIHDRIHADLPEFERQLQTSISVQTRLRTLTTQVDLLNHSLIDSETGLVPALVKTLTTHSALAQNATNARVKHEALSHLLRCRKEYSSLETLVNNGDLPEAVEACTRMEQLLGDAPVALAQANVLLDLKRKFNASKARTQDQLSDAYTRCVQITPLELTVAPSAQVRQSERTLLLPDILSSLSSSSLDDHLNTLRRDITTHYIDSLLVQPMSVLEEDYKITCVPSPPNDEVMSLRIENLSRTLQFLSNRLLNHLPTPKKSSFLRSLCKPVVSSVLNNLLIPTLPSSFDHLPSFLELLKSAVMFEETCIIGLLGNDASDTPIKGWGDGVGGHYERQRRILILDSCRSKILEPDNFADTFVVEVEVDVAKVAPEPEIVPVQEEAPEDADADAWGLDEDAVLTSSTTKADEDGWGFEDNSYPEKKTGDADGWGFDEGEVNTSAKVDDDSWGFDDDAPEDSADAPTEELPSDPQPQSNGHNSESEDAWGLDEDATAGAEGETNWDDPWGEDTSAPPKSPRPSPSLKSPKAATRLEKLANKGKKALNGNSPMSSPLVAAPVSPNVASAKISPPVKALQSHSPQQLSLPSTDKLVEKRPPNLSFSAPPPKEIYVVSTRMKGILSLVREALRESREFANSRLLPPTLSGQAGSPGSTLFTTSGSILDLYCALYPVVFSAQLQSLEGPMRFSNNCLYLSGEIQAIERDLRGPEVESVKNRLDESARTLNLLGQSWYGDAVEKQRLLVDTILTQGTEGFTFTGDQDRYDECESSMNRVLQEIRRVSQKWKGTLTKSKYYAAIGSVTDAALCRVLQDVLALDDIPEVESHRLSELCRILLALEGIYVEDPEQPSFVVAYVPSWLKYSYLSELLEASLADITYLFEEGALVDFEVEELARLVRALFADTVLRTNTINKIMGGHPARK